MSTLHGATTHYGQHDPAECFGCKLKTLQFGTAITGPALMNGRDRWTNDPVKQRIEEIHKVSIDTDHFDRRAHDAKESN